MILQEHLQDTATNNPTKFSTKPATTEATTGLQQAYNIRCVSYYTILQPFINIRLLP